MRRCRHPIGQLRRRLPVWPMLPMPSRRIFERLDRLDPAEPIAEAGVGILLAPSVRIPDRLVDDCKRPPKRDLVLVRHVETSTVRKYVRRSARALIKSLTC